MKRTGTSGKVYLVGGGPGDPGLLTVRGHELVRHADVILYDALVSPDILDAAPPECERIYVGKRAGEHSMDQSAINQLLVRHAKMGRIVVRLKGGDPYVYGRGGEEARVCGQSGIPFEVVPGITSALAVPAYAGIPVLHRDLAGSVLVVHGRVRGPGAEDESTPPEAEAEEEEARSATPAPDESPESEKRGGIVVKRHKRQRTSGEFRIRDIAAAEVAVESQSREESEPRTLDWKAVCSAADTLVFLMFLGSVDDIRAGLEFGGRPPDQPVAAIQWGTTPRQRTVVSTVADFPEAIREADLSAPAVLVVGDVVRLREHLNFHERRPLFGWTIALTDSAVEHRALAPELAEAGAAIHPAPALRAAPLALSTAEMQTIRGELALATHAIFTQPALVELFTASVRESGIDVDTFYLQTRVLGVDEATLDALQSAGISATLAEGQPDETGFRRRYGAEFQASRVVVIEGEDEWGDLADDLAGAGAHVTEIPVRSWRPNEQALASLREAMENRQVTALLVLTLETARTMSRVWGRDGFKRIPETIVVVAGNELVASELVKVGARVNVTLDDTKPGTIVEALTDFRTSAPKSG